VGCYIWYSEEGPGQAAAPPSPLLAVPNITAHPSTASVQITVLLYDGPLICDFNVAIKVRQSFPGGDHEITPRRYDQDVNSERGIKRRRRANG